MKTNLSNTYKFILAAALLLLYPFVSYAQIATDGYGKIQVGEPFDGGNYDIQINGFNAMNSIIQVQLANYGKVILDGNFGVFFQDPDDVNKPLKSGRYNSIRISRIMNANDYQHGVLEDVYDDDDDVKSRITRFTAKSSSDSLINPKEVIALLVGSVQNATKRISENSAKIATIEMALSSAHTDSQQRYGITDITAVMGGMVFAVSVPEHTDNRVVITDVSGNIEATLKISDGVTTVSSSQLRGKTHVATLICNGSIVDSKTFVNQ